MLAMTVSVWNIEYGPKEVIACETKLNENDERLAFAEALAQAGKDRLT